MFVVPYLIAVVALISAVAVGAGAMAGALHSRLAENRALEARLDGWERRAARDLSRLARGLPIVHPARAVGRARVRSVGADR